MTDPSRSPQSPTHIGKYEILSSAGEGAMGVVYRARDTVLNRTVAIKVMNATIAANEGLRTRFLHEAQSAGSLQHPNVVTIYDFGETDGYLFIAMEFVEGSDLEAMLDQAAAMPLDRKLDVMIDTLQGLEYAHRAGIIHRDLKPANIRITKEGRAKLMDFGVAHLASTRVTQTGVIVGTPHYMAPEYISGQPVTTAADIFSIGVVLYEVLTGQRPFSGETMQSLLFDVIQRDPAPPSQVASGLPLELDAVLARAMAKQPAARFASAAEMSEALADVRASLSGGAARRVTPLNNPVVSAPTPSGGTPAYQTPAPGHPAPPSSYPPSPYPPSPYPPSPYPPLYPQTPPPGYPYPPPAQPYPYGGTPPGGVPYPPPGTPPTGMPYQSPPTPAGGVPYPATGSATPVAPTPVAATPVAPSPVIRVQSRRSDKDLEWPRQRRGGLSSFLLVLVLASVTYVVYLMRRDSVPLEVAASRAAGDAKALAAVVEASVRTFLFKPSADSSTPVISADPAPRVARPRAKVRSEEPRPIETPDPAAGVADTLTKSKVDSTTSAPREIRPDTTTAH